MFEASGDIPTALCEHGSAVIGSHIYVFGGRDKDNDYSNKTYRLDIGGKMWKELKTGGERPEPRSRHLFLTYQNKVFLLGGRNSVNPFFEDFWQFDTGKTCSPLPNPPLTSTWLIIKPLDHLFLSHC